MTDLTQARLRALCCPDGVCKGKRYNPNGCWAGNNVANRLAAHDAALEAAGIPIGRLVSGEWVAVPKAPTEAMVAAAAVAVEPEFRNTMGEQQDNILRHCETAYYAALAARPEGVTMTRLTEATAKAKADALNVAMSRAADREARVDLLTNALLAAQDDGRKSGLDLAADLARDRGLTKTGAAIRALKGTPNG